MTEAAAIIRVYGEKGEASQQARNAGCKETMTECKGACLQTARARNERCGI
jgi:hypothetical protein